MLQKSPNKSKLNPQAFKTKLWNTNIKFRNQPIPILSQHEPYVYLGINLVPSLDRRTKTHITATKLIKQRKLLVTCPTTIVIRVGITYNFYAIPYSLPAIKKLDRIIIALHKTICGLPKCMSNAVTQLPHDMFSSKHSH